MWLVAWALMWVRSYCAERNPLTPATFAHISVTPTVASAPRSSRGTEPRCSIANDVSLPASNKSPIVPTTISAPGTSFIMPNVATPPENAASEMAVV